MAIGTFFSLKEVLKNFLFFLNDPALTTPPPLLMTWTLVEGLFLRLSLYNHRNINFTIFTRKALITSCVKLYQPDESHTIISHDNLTPKSPEANCSAPTNYTAVQFPSSLFVQSPKFVL